MSKKKSAIISGIILFVGILLILTGIYGADILDRITSNNPLLDPYNITADDVGKVFDLELTDNCGYIEENYGVETYIMIFNRGEDDNFEEALVAVKVKLEDHGLFYRAIMNPNGSTAHLTGKICQDNEATKRAADKGLIASYNDMLERKPELAEIMGDDWQEILIDETSPYFIMIQSKETNMIPYYCILALGILVVIAAIIVFISKFFGVKGKRIFLGFIALILIFVIVIGIMSIGKIRTYNSIVNEVPGKGLYKMNIHYNMKTDKMLKSNIASLDDFIEWVADNQLYGLPLKFDTSKFGCATFIAQSPEGDELFGRNFDYFEQDALISYYKPSKGYASIGVAATNVFGLDKSIMNTDSALGKIVMMITPYAVVDGMNEAGLGAGILELDIEEVHQNNNKNDLLLFAAIRCILDNCANVDEALELLENHDIHTGLNVSYHLFLADKSGRSVVVEWLDGKMVVIEDTACTNSVLAPGNHFGEGGFDPRYDTIKESLANSDGILTESEAMRILSDVSQNFKNDIGGTEWSCVYNLSNFTVNICLDNDYENVYTYSPEDFK